MAGRYGMSDRVGPVRVLAEHREVFLGRDYLGTQDVSQPTLVDLDAEIRRTLDAQRDVAAAVLQRQRAVLDVVRAQLGVHETLQGPELWRLLDDVAVLAGNGTRPEPG
jgi:cell division protease FtsH